MHREEYLTAWIVNWLCMTLSVVLQVKLKTASFNKIKPALHLVLNNLNFFNVEFYL